VKDDKIAHIKTTRKEGHSKINQKNHTKRNMGESWAGPKTKVPDSGWHNPWRTGQQKKQAGSSKSKGGGQMSRERTPLTKVRGTKAKIGTRN